MPTMAKQIRYVFDVLRYSHESDHWLFIAHDISKRELAKLIVDLIHDGEEIDTSIKFIRKEQRHGAKGSDRGDQHGPAADQDRNAK